MADLIDLSLAQLEGSLRTGEFSSQELTRAFIERKDEFRETLVRKGATIGANATVLCGATIGQYAMIGAGAVVTKDVPDHALMLGVPARQEGWVWRCGVTLPRVERNQTRCAGCGAGYRVEGKSLKAEDEGSHERISRGRSSH